jgi:hypothetical protein
MKNFGYEEGGLRPGAVTFFPKSAPYWVRARTARKAWGAANGEGDDSGGLGSVRVQRAIGTVQDPGFKFPWRGRGCAVASILIPAFGTAPQDPLNLSKGDEATISKFQEAEIKHGRIAMLAMYVKSRSRCV